MRAIWCVRGAYVMFTVRRTRGIVGPFARSTETDVVVGDPFSLGCPVGMAKMGNAQ